MKQDITKFVTTFLSSKQAKFQQHDINPINQPMYLFNERFQSIHMDIVGPLLPSKKLGSAFATKQKYIVTVNDRVTR